MKKKFIALISFLVFLSIMAASIPSAVASQAIRLGYLQSDLHQLAAFVALKKGFFEEEALNVKVGGIFKAGPELMSAFAAGALDMGYVGAAPAVVAVANNVAEVKIVAKANLEGSGIVVGADSSIEDLKGLAGKTVAVPGYGNVQDFLLRLALKKNDIEQGKVNVIILKPPEMIPALDTGQIDAFLAWEPYPARAVTSGVGKVLSYSGDIWPNHPCCVVAAHKDFSSQNPDLVLRFVRAHIKATRFIQENPQEALLLAQEFTGMDEPTTSQGLDSLAFEVLIDKQGIMEYAEFLVDLEIIKIREPGSFVDSLIDRSYIDRVLAE